MKRNLLYIVLLICITITITQGSDKTFIQDYRAGKSYTSLLGQYYSEYSLQTDSFIFKINFYKQITNKII